MKYLKGLTYEELILFIILDRLDNKYEEYPKIIFYEFLKTIDGKNVILSEKLFSGYNELDCVIYSKCDYQYDDDKIPLIIQERYESPDLWFKDKKFEIKNNTLYMLELKPSYYLDREFFNKLFSKCKEFENLYETKGWINNQTNKEIILIYDSDINNQLDSKYGQLIKEFVNENKNMHLILFILLNHILIFLIQ